MVLLFFNHLPDVVDSTVKIFADDTKATKSNINILENDLRSFDDWWEI